MSRETNGMLQIHAAGVAGLLALGVAGYLLVASPILKGRSERVSFEQRVRASEVRLASLRESRSALRKELELGQARVDARGVTLLPPSGRNTRLGDLTRLAEACGLRLDRLQPGAPEDGELLTLTPIVMEGVGAYDDVGTFLHRLVSEYDDLGARSFRLEATDVQGARLASFVFDLVWYTDPADQSGG